MPKVKKTHCMRGHEFNKRNTIFRGNRRTCRVCTLMRLNFLYRHDEEYRKKKLQYGKEYRAAIKAKLQQQPIT